MRRLIFSAYVLAGAGLACGTTTTNEPDGGAGGDGGGGDGGGGDFTLSVAPTSVTIPIGGSAVAALSVARVGSVGEVTLSARDLPAGVSVEFATNPLAGGASDVTILAMPGAQPGTSTITIVGTAGTTERTATLDVTVESITVSGNVDRPGVTVVLVGKAPVTADGSGNFTFTDVVPPYDLYTYTPVSDFVGGTSYVVYYYEGLARPDPHVSAGQDFFIVVFPLPQGNSTVSGSLTGTFSAANQKVVMWSSGGEDTTITAGGGYSFAASWLAGATHAGTLYGLQWSLKGTNAPDVFTGFAMQDTTLTDEGASTIGLALTTPTTVALTGTLTQPAGFPVPTIKLKQQLGTRQHQLWTANTGAIEAGIPVLTVGAASLHAVTTLDGATSEMIHPGLAAATDVSFTMPTPSAMLAPAADATGVTSATPIQFTPPADSVSQVWINGGGRTFVVFTSAAEVTIPSVTELAIPASTTMVWSVHNYGPFTDVDAATGPERLQTFTEYTTEGSRRFRTSTPSRSFTTSASP